MLKKSHLIKGLPMAVITTLYMKDAKGNSVIEHFLNPEFNLQYIIEPPYGFYVTDQQYHTNKYNDIEIVNIFSDEFIKILKKIKILVFDMQTLGVKNTVIAKMLYHAIETIAQKDIVMYVLDRPNPLNGQTVNGMIGEYSRLNIPLRHGLTPGEMALFMKEDIFRDSNVKVIEMKGYKRDLYLDDIQIDVDKIFPHIHNINSFYFYSGFHLMEGTNISIGKGTELEFSVIGAPWMDSEVLLDQIIYLGLEGFEMESINFIPEEGIYKGQRCNGILFKIINKQILNCVELFLNIIEICYNTFAEFEFIMNDRDNYIIDELFSDTRIRKSLERYIPLWDVYFKSMKTIEDFIIKREKILLYK